MTDPEFRELLLAVLRADFTASETCAFVAGPQLTCPITALGGEQDEDATPGEIGAWQRHTTGRFELTAFAGDHLFIDDAWEAVVTTVGERCRAPRLQGHDTPPVRCPGRSRSAPPPS
ncbi:thioesterase II family protein [Streptomyces rubiginosohelvolus]